MAPFEKLGAGSVPTLNGRFLIEPDGTPSRPSPAESPDAHHPPDAPPASVRMNSPTATDLGTALVGAVVAFAPDSLETVYRMIGASAVAIGLVITITRFAWDASDRRQKQADRKLEQARVLEDRADVQEDRAEHHRHRDRS